jgi:hypothetical protein
MEITRRSLSFFKVKPPARESRGDEAELRNLPDSFRRVQVRWLTGRWSSAIGVFEGNCLPPSLPVFNRSRAASRTTSATYFLQK